MLNFEIMSGIDSFCLLWVSVQSEAHLSWFNFNPTPAIAHSNCSSNLVIHMPVDDIITRSSEKAM